MKKMWKKFLILLLFCLFLVAIVKAEAKIDWSQIVQKYFFVTIERYRIAMETLIEFGEEIGKDVNEMKKIKNDFLIHWEDLKGALNENNKEKIEANIEKLKGDVKKFRREAQKQLKGYEKKAKDKLKKAGETYRFYFINLLNEARNLHKDKNLEILDEKIKRAESIIKKIKDKGYETKEIEQKLNEIKDQREDFKETMDKLIEACRQTSERIFTCKTEVSHYNCSLEKKKYCQIKEKIITNFKQLQKLIYQTVGL